MTVDLARTAAHALLDRAPGTTALFAFSDRLALAARDAARERGLAVPRDLSTVGFDDTAPTSEGLTTVHQPLRDKGRIAAQRLLHSISHRPVQARSELLPTRLVISKLHEPAARRLRPRATSYTLGPADAPPPDFRQVDRCIGHSRQDIVDGIV